MTDPLNAEGVAKPDWLELAWKLSGSGMSKTRFAEVYASKIAKVPAGSHSAKAYLAATPASTGVAPPEVSALQERIKVLTARISSDERVERALENDLMDARKRAMEFETRATEAERQLAEGVQPASEWKVATIKMDAEGGLEVSKNRDGSYSLTVFFQSAEKSYVYDLSVDLTDAHLRAIGALAASPPEIQGLREAVEVLDDRDIRHIAESKDVATCRQRIIRALTPSTGTREDGLREAAETVGSFPVVSQERYYGTEVQQMLDELRDAILARIEGTPKP